MFGTVIANLSELNDEQKERYNAVYCGICRQIRERASNLSRLSLSYDMVFLALLEMSLYEPEEVRGDRACILHPIKPKSWVEGPCIEYAADMNVALAYYNCLDDWQDDRRLSAKAMAEVLRKHSGEARTRYPRQCEAIEVCIRELSRLEKENCANPDEPANCFGRLMAELMVWQEDMWAETMRRLGFHLGRFIYLADAAMDYKSDLKRKKYNPFIAMGTGEDKQRWEEYLVLAMARCTEEFEKLPLVQDKALLDNILYSGVWASYHGKQREKTGGES